MEGVVDEGTGTPPGGGYTVAGKTERRRNRSTAAIRL
jgi:hypothetical protein